MARRGLPIALAAQGTLPPLLSEQGLDIHHPTCRQRTLHNGYYATLFCCWEGAKTMAKTGAQETIFDSPLRATRSPWAASKLRASLPF